MDKRILFTKRKTERERKKTKAWKSVSVLAWRINRLVNVTSRRKLKQVNRESRRTSGGECQKLKLY